jgi:hypothetical protein
VVILDHLYSSLLNTDNNSTTGLTTDRFGGPLAVGGAIYIRVDTKKQRCIYSLQLGMDLY